MRRHRGDATPIGEPAPGGSDAVGGLGRSMPEPPVPRRPWHARRGLVVVAAVVVIGTISVLLDLPHHASATQRTQEATAVVTAVNSAIKPCTYSVAQAFSILQREHAGTVTAAELRQFPGIISDDEKACSSSDATAAPLGTTVFGTLTLSSTPAGRDLTTMVRAVLDWTTFDAPGAIEDIRVLLTSPDDAKASKDLQVREQTFAKDRTAADRAIRQANTALRSSAVPDPDLPKLPDP